MTTPRAGPRTAVPRIEAAPAAVLIMGRDEYEQRFGAPWWRRWLRRLRSRA